MCIQKCYLDNIDHTLISWYNDIIFINIVSLYSVISYISYVCLNSVKFNCSYFPSLSEWTKTMAGVFLQKKQDQSTRTTFSNAFAWKLRGGRIRSGVAWDLCRIKISKAKLDSVQFFRTLIQFRDLYSIHCICFQILKSPLPLKSFFLPGYIIYIQGVFLTGTPTKKLKCGKPRLGESTLT